MLHRTHHISLARSILELKSPEEIDSFVLNLSLGHLLGQHISAEAWGQQHYTLTRSDITHYSSITLKYFCNEEPLSPAKTRFIIIIQSKTPPARSKHTCHSVMSN